MQFFDNSIQFTNGALFMTEITHEVLLAYDVTLLGNYVTCSRETVSICWHENECSRFLQNVFTYLPNYMVARTR